MPSQFDIYKTTPTIMRPHLPLRDHTYLKQSEEGVESIVCENSMIVHSLEGRKDTESQDTTMYDTTRNFISGKLQLVKTITSVCP